MRSTLPWRAAAVAVLLALAVVGSGCDERRWFAEEREYVSLPDPSCNGSAENPHCGVSVFLYPDGRLLHSFDDILVEGEYWIIDRTVTLEVDTYGLHYELELSEDESTLGDMIRVR